MSASSTPRKAGARGMIAHSGLVAAIAFGCVMAPLAPGLAVRAALGGLLVAAGGLALLIAPVVDLPGGRAFRLGWPLMTALVGGLLMASFALPDKVAGLGLAAYLAVQGVILFIFASHARRQRELGSPALTFEGLLSLALAALTFFAFPFQQNWVLGAVIAVGLLDYASVLTFMGMEASLSDHERTT